MWACVALSWFLYFFRLRHPRIDQARNWLKRGMYFNGFLELFLTTYFDFLLSAYFTIKFGAVRGDFDPYREYFGEILSLTIAVFTIIMTLVVIPVCSVLIIVKSDKELNQPIFIDTIGALYDNIKTKKGRWARAFTLIFILRRLFMLVIAFTNVPTIFQCLPIMFINLFMMIYLGRGRILKET